MTFFLPDTSEAPAIKAKLPPRSVSTTAEGYAAAFKKSAIENDANFQLQRETDAVSNRVARDAVTRLGFEKIEPVLKEFNDRARATGFHTPIMQENMQDAIEEFGPKFRDQVMQMARDEALQDPEAWQDVDLSQEGIDAAVNERFKADHQDAEEILSMMPSGRGAAEFIGGMAGISIDIKNLPFLALGGGSGSFMRVAGREAMINASAEAAFLPSQFEMAERLDIPDPDVATQLAMAATFGAAVGVGGEALQRGFKFFNTRGGSGPTQDFDNISVSVMADQAEDAFASGSPDALSEIAEIPFKTTRTNFPDNQINSERPSLALTSDQRIFTTPLPKVDGAAPEPLSKEQLVENITKAIDEAENADTRGNRPLTDYLKGNHKTQSSAGISRESLQIHPEGFMADELRARGLGPKNAPGLFSRERGRADFDNLPANEMEELFPGISEATGTKPGDPYLNRDGFVEVLARDMQGDKSYLRSNADADALRRDLAAIESDSVSAFVRMESTETPNGLFFTRDQVEFMGDRDLDVVMDDWFERSGYGEILDDVEMEEIRAEIGKSGGDPEYLVERVLEREADFVEGKFDGPETREDVPFDGPVREDGSPTGEPPSGAREARGGSEGEGGRGENARQSESTDAGEQILAPGFAPVGTRERLEAAQGAPLRGGDADADHGLFDVTARSQADMFDDVTSPEARAVHEVVSNDIRTAVETDGDFDVEIELPDGTTKKMKASAALDHLDQGDAFSARASLCGKGSE